MIIQDIQKITNDIISRYKKLGKKVFAVTCSVAESSGLNGFSGGDCVPLGCTKDGKQIFIDPDALINLTKETAYVYIPHELAHCFSNQNHSGQKFQEFIEDYNDYYNPQTIAEPDDNLNKKYLPIFYKKDEAYSKVKSNEEWNKLLKEKPWKKNYFPY